MNFYLCGIGNPHPLIANAPHKMLSHYLARILMLLKKTKQKCAMRMCWLYRWLISCKCMLPCSSQSALVGNVLLLRSRSFVFSPSDGEHWCCQWCYRNKPKSKLFSINSVISLMVVYLKWQQAQKLFLPLHRSTAMVRECSSSDNRVCLICEVNNDNNFTRFTREAKAKRQQQKKNALIPNDERREEKKCPVCAPFDPRLWK